MRWLLHQDILYCRAYIPQVVNETLPALQELKQTGLVRHIGITGLPLKIFPAVLDRWARAPSRAATPLMATDSAVSHAKSTSVRHTVVTESSALQGSARYCGCCSVVLPLQSQRLFLRNYYTLLKEQGCGNHQRQLAQYGAPHGTGICLCFHSPLLLTLKHDGW